MRTATKRTAQTKHMQNLSVLLDRSIEVVSDLYKQLKLIETTGHKYAEQYCNGDLDSDNYEQRLDVLRERLRVMLPQDVFKNIQLNGDPRGYFLKLDDDYVRSNNVNIERDWGGYGILCPDNV